MRTGADYGIRVLFLVLGCLVGCSPSEPRPPAIDDQTAVDRGTPGMGGGVAEASSAPDASRLEADAGGDGGPPPLLSGPTNCGEITCAGEGAACEETRDGPRCTCVDGYLLQGSGSEFECVVNTQCVKVRFLERFCRVRLRREPIVGLFFGVDYCAGTAVLPGDLGDLDEAFEVLEDGNPLHAESKIKFIERRDVESYVAIALDISTTMADNPVLRGEVIDGLLAFVDQLGSPAGAPPMTASLLVFARKVGTLVPFTRDLAKVTSALEQLKADPRPVLRPVLGANLDGTALMPAVEKGIRELERMQDFRQVVTDSGVLTSATLVVVTDGGDSNHQTRPPAVVRDTLVNVISVGVSEDIHGPTLAAIGRDGAFLAPTIETLSDTFSRVARRVEEHPERGYLLSYCSATTQGRHDVTVRVKGKDNQIAAKCAFDADMFGNDECDPSLYETGCAGRECGSMFACGACADDRCCTLGKCEAPEPNPFCNGQDELCQPGGDVCVGGACIAPLPVGAECGGSVEGKCEDGVSICQERLCEPLILATGQDCGAGTRPLDGRHCPELNCSRENSQQPFLCGPRARLYEPCSGANASAVCEQGAHCSTTCRVRGPSGFFRCNSDSECASGYCDRATRLCVDDGYCHYSWDSKLD